MRKFLSVFSVALVAGIFAAMPVFAETSYEAAVRANCATLDSALGQLQRRDLVSRINRGRAYQDLLDQTRALDSRIHSAGLDTNNFDAQYTNLSAQVDGFRSTYEKYDNQMSNLLQVDCTAKAGDFVVKLSSVRDSRKVLDSSVADIQAGLDAYRQLVVALQAQLAQAEAGLAR